MDHSVAQTDRNVHSRNAAYIYTTFKTPIQKQTNHIYPSPPPPPPKKNQTPKQTQTKKEKQQKRFFIYNYLDMLYQLPGIPILQSSSLKRF